MQSNQEQLEVIEPIEKKRKINFKQPKYIVPLVALPFILFIGYQFINLMGDNKKEVKQEELSTSLGDSRDSIMGKNDAYDAFFEKTDNRTMLDGLNQEIDSTMYYNDNLTLEQKRKIDSLKALNAMMKQGRQFDNNSYYQPQMQNGRNSDRDYEKSAEMIRMLNSQAQGNYGGGLGTSDLGSSSTTTTTKYDDPVKTLKAQMLVMDSIDKAKDPAYQEQLKAEQRLKRNREKLAKYLNSTLRVRKAGLNPFFNTITTEEQPNFVKAIIDENSKGYLGSRIRFRLLEDVYVSKYVLPKGTLLYGNITGFSLQRVNLNIVSVLYKGEILPINLSIFDLDGQKGLYVPASAFREMAREMGVNSVQGTQLESNNQGFFSSIGTKLFSSASQTLANILRKNKAKLKYNSFVYLINEKDLQNAENN